MPRDGTKNLIPLTQRSEEEQKRLRSKAGKKSGEARRQKRLLRDTLEDILNSKSSSGKTYQEEISMALFKAALNGDTKAYEIIRDTVGQKPIDQIKAEIETPVFKNDLDE